MTTQRIFSALFLTFVLAVSALASGCANTDGGGMSSGGGSSSSSGGY